MVVMLVVVLVVISYDVDGGRTSAALFSTAASSTLVVTRLNTRVQGTDMTPQPSEVLLFPW